MISAISTSPGFGTISCAECWKRGTKGASPLLHAAADRLENFSTDCCLVGTNSLFMAWHGMAWSVSWLGFAELGSGQFKTVRASAVN